MQTEFLRHFCILLLMVALLASPLPVCSSSLPTDPASSSVTDPASPQASQVASLLLVSPATREAEQWKTSFSMHPGRQHGHDTPEFLLQRAEYRGNGYSLMSEMGDLLLEESPNTVQETKQRGGMLTFGSGNRDNAFRLKSFATTGQGEGILAGTSAELSLLKERARFKTIYISGRESISPEGATENFREKNGSVLGLMTVLEPVKDLLAIEAEADYSLFDPDTTDDAASLRDSAYRLKARGTAGPYRYSATFERTGPRYHVINGNGPLRNLEGVALNMGAGFQLHALDFSLSRHNDNLGNDRFVPRFYRSEGNIDYTFKGITCLPMGVRYRKTLLESAREPVGYGQSASDADTFSGRLNYVAGEWDLGMKASYFQRKDKILDQRETEATSIAFSPKISSGQVTVAPDISLRRSRFFKERQRSDEYAIHLGIQGKGKLDYEVRGGYRKERSGPSSGSDVIGASVRMGYPLDRIIRKVRKPSLRLKCEYNDTANRTTEKRDNFYSFLLTVDGASFF